VIMKPLIDGSVAVGLFNPADEPAAIKTDASSLGMAKGDCYAVRDLWAHTDATSQGEVGQTVPAHGVAMLRVTPGCR
jgi:alpha-galactosidase